ncbi:MAG: thiamine pyrophosphate-dependent enzyme, partial [Tistlia sp.]
LGGARRGERAAQPGGGRGPRREPEIAEADLAPARALLAASRRPLVIAGLQACEPAAAQGLQRLLAAWDCPLLYSYKAKGVVPDDGRHAVGPFIDGDAERGLIEAADAVVFYGADPIEFPPQRWRYDKPVLDLRRHDLERDYLPPQARLTGELGGLAARLEGALRPGGWTPGEILAARAEIHRRAHLGTGGPIAPQDLVDAAIAAAPAGTRATVDAGAHMLPVMSLWIARAPRDVLISRGLSTMAFALPAAIGASLAEPERWTLAFTGDGGLMMCAGELATAAQNRCRLVVVVFNDSSIALIDVKRQRRQLPRIGMSYSATDFAAVARGFGCRGYRVEAPEELPGALAEAFAGEGPAVVDVQVDAGAYHEQIRALRG